MIVRFLYQAMLIAPMQNPSSEAETRGGALVRAIVEMGREYAGRAA